MTLDVSIGSFLFWSFEDTSSKLRGACVSTFHFIVFTLAFFPVWMTVLRGQREKDGNRADRPGHQSWYHRGKLMLYLKYVNFLQTSPPVPLSAESLDTHLPLYRASIWSYLRQPMPVACASSSPLFHGRHLCLFLPGMDSESVGHPCRNAPKFHRQRTSLPRPCRFSKVRTPVWCHSCCI